MNRIGLICSGGGAVMAAAYDILTELSRTPNWVMVSDRACNAEQRADIRGIPIKRVEYRNAVDFSSKASYWLFEEKKCDCSVLLFTRLVGPSIYDSKPCINLHPSLLPLFPGLGSLTATHASGMTIMGATAHRVDQSMDGGPIIAQVWSPRPTTRETIQRVSFAQKLYLLLLLQEALANGHIERALTLMGTKGTSSSVVAKPAIADKKLNDAFRSFLRNEGISWPTQPS